MQNKIKLNLLIMLCCSLVYTNVMYDNYAAQKMGFKKFLKETSLFCSIKSILILERSDVCFFC